MRIVANMFLALAFALFLGASQVAHGAAPGAAPGQISPHVPRSWLVQPAVRDAMWGFFRMGFDKAKGTGKGITIAVIDSGLDDDPLPASFRGSVIKVIDVKKRGQLRDWNGHGTAVASLLAASRNRRFGGLVPDAKLIIISVGDLRGEGNWSDLAQGVVEAVEGGADIINISMGGALGNETLRRAMEFAAARKVLVVCAAGNEGKKSLYFPAAFPHTIAVTASDQNDKLCAFSNYGPGVDFIAPGKDILLLYQAPGTRASDKERYSRMNGTSMSTPYVTAAVALALEAGAPRNKDGMVAYLKKHCVSLGLDKEKQGHGLIRVDRIGR